MALSGLISSLGQLVTTGSQVIQSVMSSVDAKACKTQISSTTNTIQGILKQMKTDQLKFQTDNAQIQAQAQALQQQVNEWNDNIIKSTQEYNDLVKQIQALQQQQSTLTNKVNVANNELFEIKKKKLYYDGIETCSRQPLIIGLATVASVLILTSALHLRYSFTAKRSINH